MIKQEFNLRKKVLNDEFPIGVEIPVQVADILHKKYGMRFIVVPDKIIENNVWYPDKKVYKRIE